MAPYLHSFLSRQRFLGVLLLLGGLAGVGWLTTDLPARTGMGERRQAPRAKPRKEEEEDDTPAKPIHKIVRPQEPGKERPKTEPARKVPDAGDLKTAARKASNPTLKEFFSRLAIPYDVVSVNGYETRINGESRGPHDEYLAPIPPYVGDNPDNLGGKIQVTRINTKTGDLSPRKHDLSVREVGSIDAYEERALKEVDKFFVACNSVGEGQSHYLKMEERLQAAEFALAAVIRWHESAVQTHVRAEKGWEEVERKLRKKLLDVLVQQLELLTRERDWSAAFALARRLSDAYHSPSDQAAIAKPLTELLKLSMLATPVAVEGASNLRIVQKRLHDLMELFPDSKEYRVVTDYLSKQAQTLLDAARKAEKDGDAISAQMLLKQAEETWPDLPGLRDYRLELNRSHPVLRVGVKQLPEYMAPGWATTDSELRAVELLFESLVKFVDDGQGSARYQPGLAVGRPRVIPLGRRLRLPVNAYWSDNERLNATDVRSTVALYQQRHRQASPGRVFLSPAWGELLEGAEVRGDPFHVNLTLRQGYLEPLALMTFKVFPGHKLSRLNSESAWMKFAQEPVGSGPFRFATRTSEPVTRRDYVGFLANSSYGNRPDKLGLPLIREIRMYTSKDPVQDLNGGKLDLALDLTVEQAEKVQGRGVKLLLPEPQTPNRRIYFLAVNHQTAPLNKPEVRRALALALNRKKLLNDHFRGKFGDRIHKILNGPYPAGSWACSSDVDLDGKPDRAQAALAGLKGPRLPNTKIQLKYPTNDAALAKAMQALCQQVKDARLGIELVPVAEEPLNLRHDVEETKGYELAYYHHDFNDDTFWLWPLLGPGNYLNYENEQVQAWLRRIMNQRNFAQVRQETQLLHRDVLTLDMPIIPLWQLDPLAAVAVDRLRTGPFDPLRVFSNVENWRLDAK